MSIEEYNEYLNLIKIKDPQNVLLPELILGFSAENAIYIEHIAKNLDKTAVHVSVEFPEEKYAQVEQEDDIIRSLYIQKKQLFDERRKYSNRFHDCINDAQRKQNSNHILYVQDKIEDVMKKISSYKDTGTLPMAEDNGLIDPDKMSGIELSRRLLSLRSNLSREKKLAIKSLEMPEGPKKTDRIATIEERIKRFEIEKIKLEHAIKAAASQT